MQRAETAGNTKRMYFLIFVLVDNLLSADKVHSIDCFSGFRYWRAHLSRSRCFQARKAKLGLADTDERPHTIAGNTVFILRKTISYAPSQILWCEFLPDYPRRAGYL